MIAGAAVLALALAQPDLALRAGEAPPTGTIKAADAAGVVVGSTAGDVTVGWDRVRRLDGMPEAAPFVALGERAWRARTRLERGDAPLAEPLFEELFAFYQWRPGPTAAVVAEGLLRCRLRRGAHLAAIDPWLSLLSARAEGGEQFRADWAGQAGLGPVIDPVSGLAPALPPMWPGLPVVQASAARTTAAPEGSAQANALAALYRHAARFEAGWQDPWPQETAGGAAAQVVTDIVAARTGDAAQRAAARARLRERLSAGADPWLDAWLHAALGRSLAREEGRDDRLTAVVELLHVPALHGAAQPYLAGLCMAEAAVVLDAAGDRAGAARLADELINTYPGHAALDWEPFRTRWVRTLTPPTPNVEPGAGAT